MLMVMLHSLNLCSGIMVVWVSCSLFILPGFDCHGLVKKRILMDKDDCLSQFQCSISNRVMFMENSIFHHSKDL